MFVPTPKPGDFPLRSLDSRLAMRAEVERIKRKPKPMVRIFEDGVLETEYEREGMKEDIIVHIEHIGHYPPNADSAIETAQSAECSAVQGDTATIDEPTKNLARREPQPPAAESQAAVPAASSPTEAESQSSAIVPRTPRLLVGAVGYLQGMR